MKRAALLILLLGCRKSDPDAAADNTPKKAKLARCVVEKNGKEFSIGPKCDVSWNTKFELAVGERLTIGPGSRVSFSGQGEITVKGGSVVAKGTSAEPIALTASDGEFHVWLDDAAEVSPASTFEQVQFDRVALHARGTRARIELTDVRFRWSKLALGIIGDDELVVGKRLSFDGNKIDVQAPAKTLTRLESTTFASSVRLTNAPIVGSIALPPAATHIVDRLGIEDGTLTFPEGAIVQFATDGTIFTVSGKAAALIAKKAKFTSMADTPKAGDWAGLELNASPSKLEGCTIEYARSAIRVSDVGTSTIVNTTFRNNGSAGIEAPDCAVFEDPTKGNTAPGGTLCRVAAPLGGYGGLGLIGTGPGTGSGWGDGIGLGTVGGFGGAPSGILGGSGGGSKAPTAKIIEKSTTVVGKLPPEVVKRIVRANYPRLRACYEQGRKSDPSIAGTVDVKFVIDATGAVTTVSATAGTLKHTGMIGCVHGMFRTLSFPEPEGGIVTVSMTHEYAPL